MNICVWLKSAAVPEHLLQTGQAPLQVRPMFRGDSYGLVSVDSLARRATFLMLRNKEPKLAENIDSSIGRCDLGFYRVNFVFGSRHLIIVPSFLYLR